MSAMPENEGQKTENGVVLQGVGLTKQFRSGDLLVDALRGVDITINRGEIVAIIGPSGSGKSTMMGILGGLDSPTEGRLEIGGIDVTNMGENELAEIRNAYIGFVFQQFNLMPTLTAVENVSLPIQFASERKFNPRERATELLTTFGLEDRLKNRPSQLSGGEQQRVAIARARANDPPLLLCDEPTGALDTENGNLVMDTLFQAQAKLGTAIVIVTHDPRVAERADRTLVMTDGRFATAD
jgi:ABC-type lipoprotein export system ATPase subunit